MNVLERIVRTDTLKRLQSLHLQKNRIGVLKSNGEHTKGLG